MPDHELIHLPSAGSIPGIPGHHGPGVYLVNWAKRTIQRIEDIAREELEGKPVEAAPPDAPAAAPAQESAAEPEATPAPAEAPAEPPAEAQPAVLEEAQPEPADPATPDEASH